MMVSLDASLSTHGKVDSIEGIAGHVASFDDAHLPDRVLKFQKLRVLDNLGCLIAGWNAPAVPELQEAMRGDEESELPMLVRNGRLALRDFVFIHSVMARAHDFCDVMSPGYHPGSTDVPIALAMAKMYGRSGREVLTALALGLDVATRINLAAQENGFAYRGFDPNVLALFSGTAVAARLMGLDAAQTHSALGFAFNHGVGSFQMYSDKTEAVRIAQGTVSAACIDAVTMASKGLRGVRRVLDGEEGFFNVYAPGRPERLWLTEGLGRNFLGEEKICFKLYPSCSVTLALTDACLRLRERNAGFEPASANCHIHLRVSPVMYRICGHAFECGATPSVNAMFSVQYVAANALMRGRSTLFEFAPEAVCDRGVAEVAGRIFVECVQEMNHFDACEVRISTADSSFSDSEFGRFGKGWPENPVNADELRGKFLSNVRFADVEWLEERSGRLLDQILALDSLTQLDRLFDLLSARSEGLASESKFPTERE